jgi:hypothetical protein
MLAHLWAIRMVLVARNNTALTAKVDEALNTKPPALKDEQWKAAQREILLRRRQKEERVLDRDVSAHEGEALAHRLLREAKADEETMGPGL